MGVYVCVCGNRDLDVSMCLCPTSHDSILRKILSCKCRIRIRIRIAIVNMWKNSVTCFRARPVQGYRNALPALPAGGSCSSVCPKKMARSPAGKRMTSTHTYTPVLTDTRPAVSHRVTEPSAGWKQELCKSPNNK